jgi:hypothetical protein
MLVSRCLVRELNQGPQKLEALVPLLLLVVSTRTATPLVKYSEWMVGQLSE